MERKNSLLISLLDISNFLNSKEYRFALIGGLAYSVVCKPRATMDIDFLIEIKDIETFITDLLGFKKFIMVHEKPMKFKKATIERAIYKDNLIVDFLIADDEYKRNAVKRSIEVNINNERIFIVTPEDIVILKLISNRDVDIPDVKNLLKLKSIDINYINYWVKKLNLKIPK